MISGITYNAAFPQSVLNTVTLSSLTTSCTSSNLCAATVTSTNNNQTSNFVIWFTLKNSLGQTVFLGSYALTAAPKVNTITMSLGTLASGGGYTITVFAQGTNAQCGPVACALSGNLATTFQTGTLNLTINPFVPSDTGSITCTASVTCASPGTTPIPSGTTVTLTFVPGTNILHNQFQTWLINCDNPNQLLQPTANPYTLTMNLGNCIVGAATTFSGSSITVYPQVYPSGTGSISPSTGQVLWSSSTLGPTSATFTETPAAGYYFTSWQVTGVPSITGTSPTITITYASLQGPLLSNFYLQANFAAQPCLNVATSSAAITLNLPLGNSCYNPGTVVTLTATVPSNYCWLGFSVDALPNQLSKTITITMNANHGVLAIGYVNTSNLCGGGGGGGGGLGFNPLGLIIFIAGAFITGYGYIKKGKKQ